MITIYIKEMNQGIDKLNIQSKIIKNVVYKFIKMFNIVQVEEIEENKKIYVIPNIDRISVYKRITKKLIKEQTKTQKIQIVLSEKLKKYENLFSKFKIISGKGIFINHIEEVIDKVIGDNVLEMQDIYITTNFYNESNINIVKKLASKVKSINIITKEIEKYKILEEIMQNDGIAICVANNKKKSLKKAKIVINLDFSKENLNEYILNRNAIIININQDKIVSLKGFEGIVIRDIDIILDKKQYEFKRNNRLDNFKNIEIFETLINKNDKNIKINVNKLCGNNGEITEYELKKWQEEVL